MPYDLGGTVTGKPPKGKQRITLRVRSHTEGDIHPLGDGGLDGGEGTLPPAFRNRLHDLFLQIEKEFEHMYAENLALQDRLDGLSERREKDRDRDTLPETTESTDSSSKPSSKLKGTSVQKIKPAQKLKVQTSKFVSSFKAPTLSSSFIREYQGHKDGVWDVAVSHSQPILGTASADHTARLWNLESSQCLSQYLGHSGSVNSIRFHPSQDLVLTASGDYTAHVWKPPITADQLRTHSSEEEVEGPERDESMEDGICSRVRGPLLELRGHGGVVIAADWLVGGDQIITASWDRSANLWDCQTGDILHNLTGHDQDLSHCCAHPSQKLAVTASKDTTFRLWDFREAIHSVSVFQGHTDTVTSVVFTRGEEKVLSGSDDRTVKLWDLRNMRSPLDNVQCDSQVNRLAVSPASRILAIPLDNRHVRLYDLQQHRLARLPRSNRQGHRRMVCAAAWTNDGLSSRANLFTCGFDRLLLGWNVANPKDHKE